MSKRVPQEETPVTEDSIAEEVVEHDHDLAKDANTAKRRARDAKERSGEAIATLNQWRWEMTVCEFGPRYSGRVYAEAVGQHHSTVIDGAAAWQAHLDASNSSGGPTNHSGCSFGDEPHHPREIPPPLTTAQVQSHGKAQRRLNAGEVKAILIERLAAHWNMVPTTVQVNYRSLVNEAVARFRSEHDPDSMDEGQITTAADTLARQMRLEWQQRDAKEKVIQKWMTKNRATDQPVPMNEVRKMYDHIERRMASRNWTWEQAEADARDWDFGCREADRFHNEMERKARIAVLELRGSAARIKSAAIKLGLAMKAIEADSIPLTDDERTLVTEDIADALGIVQQAAAAVGGESGTDWDAALEALIGGQS